MWFWEEGEASPIDILICAANENKLIEHHYACFCRHGRANHFFPHNQSNWMTVVAI